MAELSIINNTLLPPLTAIFSQWLITLTSFNNDNTHTKNKYSSNPDNNNSPLQYMSQIHKSTYTKIKRQTTTTTFETEKIMKSLKSEVSHDDEISTKQLKISSP